VPAGEAFAPGQSEQIGRAVAAADAETGLTFSVYVGRVHGETRPYAQRLHAALGVNAARGVLVLIEPQARRVEVVTGDIARRRLDDRAAGLASLSMATAFSGGELTSGIVNGLRMMAQAAARPPVLHESEIND
jgi:uncharacterized membrane protein YgcG